jgi:hypothetical protein
MAKAFRAQDVETMSRGFDSIRSALLQRKLEEFQAQKDAEEKQRYNASMARQLQLDQGMEDFRQHQMRQGDAAGEVQRGTLALHQEDSNRRAAADARTADERRDEAMKGAAFQRQFTGEPNPDTAEFEDTMDRKAADPTNPTDVLRAGAATGALPPDKLAQMAVQLYKADNAGGKTQQMPEPFSLEVPMADGSKRKVSGVVHAGVMQIMDGTGKSVAEATPLMGPDGKAIPGQYVYNGQRFAVSAAKPADLTPHFKRIGEIDNEMSAIPPYVRAQDKEQAAKWQQLKTERDYHTGAISGQQPGTNLTATLLGPVNGPGAPAAPQLPPAPGSAAPMAPTAPTAPPPMTSAPASPFAAPATKQVTPDLAKQFLKQAGGDKNAARELARKQGYTF